MIKTFKTRLNPTKEQEEYFWLCARSVRDTYNYCLGRYNELYELHKQDENNPKPNIYALKREFNKVKKEQERYEHVPLASVQCVDYGVMLLQSGFSVFFDIVKGKRPAPKTRKPRKDGKPKGYPKFKSRYDKEQSFYTAGSSVKFNGHMIKLPKVGWVNMAEQLPYLGCKIGNIIIKHDGIHWYINFPCHLSDYDLPFNENAIGLDMGLKDLIVDSNGNRYNIPYFTKDSERKLAQLQRKLARQKKGSERYKKTKLRIAKLHKWRHNSRHHHTNKITSEIVNCEDYGIIGIEDLNVAGMAQMPTWANKVYNSSIAKIFNQLQYKAERMGKQLVVIDRYFPSSKLCSTCGCINDNLTLNDRQWLCDCGVLHDRDMNAAINIKNEAIRLYNGC